VDPLLVILNSDSGTAAEDALDRAVEVMSSRASVEVARTSNPGELDGVLHRRGTRRVVVAGGDGSACMRSSSRSLHRRQRTLRNDVVGLLPMGTGNDFARAMGIPLEVEEAARLVIDGEVRPVDLLVDSTGKVVVNNVHVGAGAQAARRGARWKERLGSIGVGNVNLGKLGYPLGALQSALIPPSLRLSVSLDGELVNDVDRPVLMVAIGNGVSVGGGAELTPEADPEDGKVDVMISRAVTPTAKLGYVVDLARRTHPERDDVLYLRGTEVSVSGDEFYSSADGEIEGPERQQSWRLERGAYRMVLP
jgi:diacylglycerol kinase (ATP)